MHSMQTVSIFSLQSLSGFILSLALTPSYFGVNLTLTCLGEPTHVFGFRARIIQVQTQYL